MAYANIPPNLQDMFYSLGDRVAKLESGPSGPQDTADAAQATANTASSTAVAAQTTANGALTSANGKNIITYSSITGLTGTTTGKAPDGVTYTVTPSGLTDTFPATISSGATNITGDTWYVFNAAGNIIAQYKGTGGAYPGGTSWNRTQLTSMTVTTLDAGKITTGVLDATLVTVTTSATATNSITFSGANTSIDFKVGSPVAHIIPYSGGGSAIGVLMHYGASADPGGNTFPQTFAIQASAGIAGSSTYSIISTTGGNAIYGGISISGMTGAAITGAQGNTYRAVTTNGTNGSVYYGYNIYYASGGDPTVTSPTDSRVGDVYFSY